MKIANLFFNSDDIKNKLYITGLTEELEAIFVSSFFDRNKIIVTNSLLEANKLFKTLSNYEDNVLLFPKEELLTINYTGENEEFKTTRLCTLNQLQKTDKSSVVITNLLGYISLLDSANTFKEKSINFKKGNKYNRKKLIEKLINIGYKRSSVVETTGEFAVRGYVIDVFPPNAKNPVRLEFFDDELEDIRIFDSLNQKSIKKLKKKEITPFKELIDKNSQTTIKDYLKNPIVFFKDRKLIDLGLKKIQEDLIVLKKENPNFDKTKDMSLLYNKEEINFLEIDDKNLFFDKEKTLKYNSTNTAFFNEKVEKMKEFSKTKMKENKKVVFCASNKFEVNKIISLLDEKEYTLTTIKDLKKDKINIIIFDITDGFEFKNYVFINKSNLFKKKQQKSKYKNNYKYGTKIKSLELIKKGDFVVHTNYGIGIYCGIKVIEQKQIKKDYLEIKYKGKDKLYVPVEKIETLYKYSSSDIVKPKLNRLSGNEWNKRKIKVRKKSKDIAEKIFNMIVKRKNIEGFQFLKDKEEQQIFELEFPFKLTLGQEEAIKKIKKEMEKPIPMDHLLCGDVGFGKTEVAFRAAFKAIYSLKQVMYICPTTILSKQHYTNALERFSSFPIKIALLNRFTSEKEKNQIIKDFKLGKIDFLIGTHRLLSKDVIPKDLGLLIIDEEQRFGVSNKEIIKEYKNSIDVLSLSATPIPRTLQMSLVGLKTLSILETPPQDRYPIVTYVTEYNKYLLKNAILTELSRGGQVFVLYNRVKDIETKVKEIQKLVNDAKITYAHGGMSKNELEKRMYSFVQKEHDVLVCTTIIETGIDIPNVNTLIVINADRFGLSQLYQIRGRVGRSNKVAYAYLFYKKNKVLTENAIKRLKTIKEYTHLGSGINIASRDLAIRGAGDILGSDQAGFVDDIGIDLYLKILKEEIDKRQGIYMEEDEAYEKPLLNIVSHIDDKVAEEDNVKVEIHQLVNSVKKVSDIDIVKEELEDRFGRINENLNVYIYECFFERIARKLKFKRIDQKRNKIQIHLPKHLVDKIGVKELFESLTKSFENINFEYIKNNVLIDIDTNKTKDHYIYFLVDLILFIDNLYIVKK